MEALAEFKNRLPPALRKIFQGLSNPRQVQDYLDSIPYKAEELDRSPLRVMTDGQAHCLDGGMFAALAFRQIGLPPIILDLAPDPGADDDHVLALFRVDGLWGAVAKSNYASLRYREPVYRSLRELAMSYFEPFFSLKGERTLRSYTRPLDLTPFDATHWMWDEAGVKKVSARLYGLKPIPLLRPGSAARLTKVDQRSYESGMLGVDRSWAFGERPAG
jgi:hypothetical protein